MWRYLIVLGVFSQGPAFASSSTEQLTSSCDFSLDGPRSPRSPEPLQDDEAKLKSEEFRKEQVASMEFCLQQVNEDYVAYTESPSDASFGYFRASVQIARDIISHPYSKFLVEIGYKAKVDHWREVVKDPKHQLTLKFFDLKKAYFDFKDDLTQKSHESVIRIFLDYQRQVKISPVAEHEGLCKEWLEKLHKKGILEIPAAPQHDPWEFYVQKLPRAARVQYDAHFSPKVTRELGAKLGSPVVL